MIKNPLSKNFCYITQLCTQYLRLRKFLKKLQQIKDWYLLLSWSLLHGLTGRSRGVCGKEDFPHFIITKGYLTQPDLWDLFRVASFLPGVLVATSVKRLCLSEVKGHKGLLSPILVVSPRLFSVAKSQVRNSMQPGVCSLWLQKTWFHILAVLPKWISLWKSSSALQDL